MSTPQSSETPIKLFVGTSVILDGKPGWKISFDSGDKWAVDNLEQTERKFVKKHHENGNLVMGPNLTSIPIQKDSMFSRIKSNFIGSKQTTSGGKRKSSKKKRTRKSKRNKKSKTRSRR